MDGLDHGSIFACSRPAYENGYEGALMKKVTLLISIILAVGITTAFSQNDIRDKRVTIHITEAPFSVVAGTLIQDFDVPIGLEMSPLTPVDDFIFEPNLSYTLPDGSYMKWPIPKEYWHKPKKYSFSLDLDNAPLSDVMNAIIKQMPEYRWESDGKVINILPISDRDDRIIKLLATKIEKFESEVDPRIVNVRLKFTEIPEIQSLSTEDGIRISDRVEGGSTNGLRQLSGKLTFGTRAVKELLNSILFVKRGGWIVRMDRWPENEAIGSREIYLDF